MRREVTDIGIWEILAILCTFFAGSIIYFTWKNGVSPMPTSPSVGEKVAQVVEQLPQHGEIIEAGSGWGQLSLRLAKLDPHRNVVGLENSWVPLWVSRISKTFSRASNVTFYRKNIFHHDFSSAGVIVCYLYPGAMKRLDERFRRQLAPGTWIVSIAFALPSWQPEQVYTCKDLHRTKIYIYCS